MAMFIPFRVWLIVTYLLTYLRTYLLFCSFIHFTLSVSRAAAFFIIFTYLRF